MNSSSCRLEMPPLLSTRFVERPNRFLVRCIAEGKILDAHLPDPGRLKELLRPDAEMYIEHTPSIKRKTQYTVHLIQTEMGLVSINTSIPNKLVNSSLRKGCLPGFEQYLFVRAEIPRGRHRFDFELRSPSGKQVLMEVKSVTLVEENHTARFPDAVTSRGKFHAELLSELAKDGMETWILFIVQRIDAVRFTPHWERDPAFSEALLNAEKSGVRIAVLTCHISRDIIRWGRAIPYELKDYRNA
jgi:sugar fermentation stimulation protein A